MNVMDDLDAEDGRYSDDDLDALPDQAFNALQEDAFNSTQQPPSRACLPTLKQIPQRQPGSIAGGIGRLSVEAPVTRPHAQNGVQHPSSDYGDFDDEMLDGEVLDGDMLDVAVHSITAVDNTNGKWKQLGESTQREDWRQQRYSAPQPPPRKSHIPYQGQRFANAASVNGFGEERNDIGPAGLNSAPLESHGITLQDPARSTDAEALQAQVQKLLQEREALQQAIRNANDTAHAKAGEIAIVRANASKIEKEYEARTQSLQKMHADEAARQRIEVEKARAELEKIATEKDFLENDLVEGTKQIRDLQRAIKRGEEKGSGKENLPVTPRKNKGLPGGDGFDDDEVQPLSPSKLAIRSRKNTPKAGAKRKRKVAEESPVKPLDLATPKGALTSEENPDAPKILAPTLGGQQSSRPDQRFQLTQGILNHRLDLEAPRTFEHLAKSAFPSAPDTPFSTILLDKMSTLTYQRDDETFPSRVALIVVALWSQCIEEGYHEPVHLLIDLVQFILIECPLKTAPDLTNDLMSLVQSTADIILVPRCKKEPPRKDRASISANECLDIMLLMACDCQIDREEVIRFWRTIRFDFIMMLLNLINPLPEIRLMLSLLHTSVLPTTFAMIIPPNNGNQDASEAHIIDNLCHLLINTPRPAAGETSSTAADVCTLRLAVLSLLSKMLTTTHSAQALARHRLLIGYLVRVMNDELDRLYDYDSTHELRAELVNTSTRILFHLTAQYAPLINMQAKLRIVPGGEKKYLIALTRLAFSEGGFLEEGIEDDVVDCAHQMLEARVSPEEAEGLVEAFGSAPQSRR